MYVKHCGGKQHNYTYMHTTLYNTNLDNGLIAIHVHTDALYCKDKFCALHNEKLQHFHDNIISCCLSASRHILKSWDPNQCRGIPGWNEFVREYKDASILWHRLLKDSGSPNSGVLLICIDQQDMHIIMHLNHLSTIQG